MVNFLHLSLLVLACIVRFVASAPHSLVEKCTCENTPTSRNCWGNYSVDTDYYQEWPDTGVTREYWLVAKNITLAIDGYERPVLAFNGSVPGPTIEADWGDEIIIHVKNKMPDNGTAVHWHGIRQLNTNPQDGPPGITQCPIAPGDTYTYRFRATQYGSSWYHSHFSLQLINGLVGPIVIHGPATANYDVDVGPIMIMDWFHEDAFRYWDLWVKNIGFPPPVANNGLINGLNPYDCSQKPGDPKCVGTDRRFETTFKKGKKHLLRLIGAQTEGFMKFAIDNHTLTVVASDFVPIQPYETNAVILGSGQRYDVVVEADQDADASYWMRAIFQTACNFNDNDMRDTILGIVRYEGGDCTGDPATTKDPAITNSCSDEPYASLVPRVAHQVGASAAAEEAVPVAFTYDLGGEELLFHWTLHSKNLIVNWSDPTVLDVYHNTSAAFPAESNVVVVDGCDEWVYWVVQDRSVISVFHTMHLHGHDFYVLAQGAGLYVPELVELKRDNPPRRDTVMLPGNGYAVIAFKTDNPGSWLFHCHFAWHASQGLALQLIERTDDIPGIMDESLVETMEDTCSVWQDWYSTSTYKQDDSGI